MSVTKLVMYSLSIPLLCWPNTNKKGTSLWGSKIVFLKFFCTILLELLLDNMVFNFGFSQFLFCFSFHSTIRVLRFLLSNYWSACKISAISRKRSASSALLSCSVLSDLHCNNGDMMEQHTNSFSHCFFFQTLTNSSLCLIQEPSIMTSLSTWCLASDPPFWSCKFLVTEVRGKLLNISLRHLMACQCFDFAARKVCFQVTWSQQF